MHIEQNKDHARRMYKIQFWSSFNYFFLKKQLYGSFLWMGSTASRLEPLRGGSLLFATKFPEIPGTHFIDLGRMKV